MEHEFGEKITYWESRKINIGQYEGVDFGLSYTANIRHINKVDKTLEISAKDVIKPEEHKEDFLKSVERSMKRVKHVLDQKERIVRSQMACFEDEEMIDHIAKLEAQGLQPTFKRNKKPTASRKSLAENEDEFTDAKDK